MSQQVLTAVVLILGGALIVWAREKERNMEQCEVCGPMYFNEHHPDCPRKP